jgi:hypothetical protein
MNYFGIVLGNRLLNIGYHSIYYIDIFDRLFNTAARRLYFFLFILKEIEFRR